MTMKTFLDSEISEPLSLPQLLEKEAIINSIIVSVSL